MGSVPANHGRTVVGKKTNDKRRKFFAALKESGRLDKPAIRPKVTNHLVQAQAAAKLFNKCCAVKYGDLLPNDFKTCRDCPLDSSPRT